MARLGRAFPQQPLVTGPRRPTEVNATGSPTVTASRTSSATVTASRTSSAAVSASRTSFPTVSGG